MHITYLSFSFSILYIFCPLRNKASFWLTSTSSNEQGQVTSWNISIDVKYNPEQITLKWYVDGVEDVSKENQTSVSFGRPSDNGVRIYTYKGIDLTGTIIASDDPMNNNDFYRGIMQSSFIWVDSNGNTQRDPVDGLIPEYDYGYHTIARKKFK